MYIISSLGDCIFLLQKPLKIYARKTGPYNYALVYDGVTVGLFYKYVEAVDVIAKIERAITDGDKVFTIPYTMPSQVTQS